MQNEHTGYDKGTYLASLHPINKHLAHNSSCAIHLSTIGAGFTPRKLSFLIISYGDLLRL